jgi:serine/threonine-protein kinase
VGASLPDLGLPERYPLVRRIARGGMATVWCAEDAVLGRNVAIKLLADAYLHDRGAVLRFKREARAAARLSGHTNVVTIFDVGQTRVSSEAPAGRPFIVMEHLAGGTVADALRVGAYDREIALRWVHEAAAALDYAHGRGVIHRDIKPPNLLLDGNRVLHVADFGIARVGAEETITSHGQMFGTAAYISPEQALGRPATEASDRYALAVVAFELLVGERLFSSGHFAAQARRHVDEAPPRASGRNPELPRSVDRVFARGLAKQPEQRWGSARDFAAALSTALLDRPQATRMLRRSQRPRAAAAMAAASPIAAAPATTAAAPPTQGGERLPELLAPVSTGVRGWPRAAAIAAVAAVAFAVGITAGAGQGGRTPARVASTPRAGAATPPAAPVAQRAQRRHARAHRVRATPPPSAQGFRAAATTPAPTADTLEAQGHGLMVAGNYPAAIGVLRQALNAATPSSLTYAYALYDLGHSLRLGGDPRSAAVVLQQRLKIPNQTGVVRQELQLALRTIGAQVNASAPSGGAAPTPSQPRKSRHSHARAHKAAGGSAD